MQFSSLPTTAALLLTVAGTLAAPHAGMAAGLTGGSSSSAASATFIVNGSSGTLAPQLVASGTAPPAYSKMVTKATATANQTFSLLTLAATLHNIKDTASSTGLKSGTLVTASTASLGVPMGTIKSPLGTALTATATKLTSTATMKKTAAKNSPTGSATITGLKIVSSIFGIDATYTGSPKPNTILFQSKDKTVTVYLNREVTKSSGGKVKSLGVSAVNLHVANFTYQGQTVSGDLFLATSSAN
jgi:hypothetical protein